MNNEQQTKNPSRKRLSDFLFILWAGGAALLSYSLVYALRKPYTAAAFEDVEFFDMDYKVVVTISQIVGYVISKFMGIKLISELRREERLRFILMSVVMAELSLVFFGLLSAPYNIAAMFLNGLSLGCMWGVIFSFIEGRRMTDILASLLGVSMVISSGTAKSAGLYVMNNLHVNEFWMPALIGAVALPQLALLGYALNRLPQPTEEDIAMRVVQEFYAFPHDVVRCQYSHRGVTRYKRRLFSEYHRCFRIFALAFCEDRQCGDTYYPCGFRIDGFCEG